MSTHVHVVAKLQAQEGRTAQLRDVLLRLLAPTRLEAGCIRYELLERRDQPGLFVFVEEWSSEAHLDAHLSSAHVSEAAAGLGALAVGPPEILRFDRLG